MTEESFKIQLAYLQKIYGAIDDDVYRNYWEILKKYSDNEFSGMITNIIKTFVPTSSVKFPLIPHFLKAIGVDNETICQLAISTVKKSIRTVGNWRSVSFGDTALHETIERFGGWIKICDWGDKEWSINEGRFLKSYESERMSILESGPDHLKGICEIHNSENEHKFSEKQLEFAKKANDVILVQWAGFGKNNQIKFNDDAIKKIGKQVE